MPADRRRDSFGNTAPHHRTHTGSSEVVNERARIPPVPMLPNLPAVLTLALIERTRRTALLASPAAHASGNATGAPDRSKVTHAFAVRPGKNKIISFLADHEGRKQPYW
jgi:hypothetical protein